MCDDSKIVERKCAVVGNVFYVYLSFIDLLEVQKTSMPGSMHKMRKQRIFFCDLNFLKRQLSHSYVHCSLIL